MTKIESEILEMSAPRTVTRWSADEKKKFIEAVGMFGTKWKQVRDYVGTKTLAQVIGRRSTILRFTNNPDPELVEKIKTKPHTKASL